MPIPVIDNLDNVPTIIATPIYYTTHSLQKVGSITDGNGNRFRASLILFTNSVDTRVYIQKVAPDGVTVLGHVQIALQLDGAKIKHDDFGLDYSDEDLIVSNGGHALNQGTRKSPYCEARWVGVFENPGALAGTRGGASLPAPAPEPAPEVEVDYERIEQIVEQKIAEFAQTYGDDGPRKAIFDKAGDANLYMLDPANYSREYKTQRYQDVLFQFIKNANAGVQANILGGQDAWGQARRDELKQIIREVLREIDMDEEA